MYITSRGIEPGEIKAFSEMFNCDIDIVHIYKDKSGELIFVGQNINEGLTDHLFRRNELVWN